MALNLSALNFCTSPSIQSTDNRLSGRSSPGDSGTSQDFVVPSSLQSSPGVSGSYGNLQKIFLFHWILAWTNPASLCLGSQSLIVESEMGLGPCFIGMVMMVSICFMSLRIVRRPRRNPGAQLSSGEFGYSAPRRSPAAQPSSGRTVGTVFDVGERGYAAGLGPDSGGRWVLGGLYRWIPYWIIGLTVTSLSQMTWHLFVHYPFEYTQLSSMQRNFDTEVPKSVRRHDPFLRLQDMMRRYPGVKDMEFSQTQRERAYIRYNSYPLNVISKSVRMAILSWRNPKNILREPYEIYHLQQLKNTFETQAIPPFSPSIWENGIRGLPSWGASGSTAPQDYAMGFPSNSATSQGKALGLGKGETTAIHARIWKNKEKGNPQFSYSRALTLPSASTLATPELISSDSAGPMGYSLHNDLAFLMAVFTETT